MAQKKVDWIVKIHPYSNEYIFVYCDNLRQTAGEINMIEGVSRADVSSSVITVVGDLRYDIHEIKQEVEQLLASKVPDIFREELKD